MRTLSKPLCILAAVGLAACASSGGTSDPGPATPGAGTAAAPATPANPPATPTRTAAPASGGGHFTASQADAGRDTFRALCTECHYSGEFSDAQFKFKWSRRTAENLYDIIFTQMPESAPGSLTPDQATSLVAYMLRMNGFSPGSSPLAADPAVLGAISLASIRN
jgi:cytochrome c5